MEDGTCTKLSWTDQMGTHFSSGSSSEHARYLRINIYTLILAIPTLALSRCLLVSVPVHHIFAAQSVNSRGLSVAL